MKKAFIITVSVLCSVILILSVILFSTNNSLTSTSANLESLYQRSFYDLVDNVNNMEVNVSKLMVTNDSTSQQELLSNIKQQSSDAENDLSLLPVQSELLFDTTKFMNQVNGYCTSLISYSEGKIADEEFVSLGNIYNSLSIIKRELNDVMSKMMSGYKISENLGELDKGGDFSTSLSKLTNDSVEYPSLIYDGPFSNSSLQKTIKGLSDKEITENDAENLITKLFENKITNINYLGETQGQFVTYDFGVNTENGKNYFVQITKKGGFLLTMNSNIVESENSSSEIGDENNATGKEEVATNVETAKEEQDIKIDDIKESSDEVKNAQSVALDFAKKLGLENLECVWSASSKEISYVNLAPVVDEIVMYPDLIKVKIDLNNDSILGWEASSYAFNHVEREDLIAQITLEEAKSNISKNLTVDSERLCVIPLDFVGETLAYEFAGRYNGMNYYLYIDAYTGRQVRVLRVIQTDEGNLIL